MNAVFLDFPRESAIKLRCTGWGVAVVANRFEIIADAFKAQIEARVIRPGETLPSIRAIAARWHVSVSTAGKAVSLLRMQGLVTTAGRNGTIVRDPGSELVLPIGVPGVTAVSAEIVHATPGVARGLGVATGSPIVLLRVRIQDEVQNEGNAPDISDQE